MSNSRKAPTTKVQIDADWLLGPDTPAAPRTAPRQVLGSAIAILLLFSGVGTIAYYWEPWSHQVLRWQWERWLQAEQTDEDTLAALIALGETVDESTLLLIEQLKSDNTTRRSVAFQVLKSQCESSSFRKMEDSRQREIVKALEQWKPNDTDARMMRDWIAARMTTLLVSSNPTKMELRRRVSQLLDSLPDAIDATTTTNQRSAWMPGASEPAGSKAVASKPAPPILPNELRNPIAIPAEPAPAPAPTPTPTPREPTRIRIASEAKVRTIAAPRSMSISDRDPVESEPQPNKPMSVLIQVKPKQSVEQLLKSLEHVSDDEVAAIVEELHSNGFSEQQVDFAIALARGETEERLQTLSALTSDPNIHLLPWLAWITQSENQAARAKAISMLGSIADPEAIRFLQLIEQREPDPRVASQIQQALQIHRAATSNTR